MKLRNWQIDGFGVFCNASLPEPLGDGLNLLVGPNEAGKSTLLDFLRYTIFGYPSRQTSFPQREPLNGGNHGGSLTYEVNHMPYHLFRRAGKRDTFNLLEHQTGTVLTLEDLSTHRGHITLEVFRNIFGFSLEEMQGIESFKKAGMRELVFAASVGQSVGRISEIQGSLQKQAATLFNDRAKAESRNAPQLLKLRTRLSEVEGQLELAEQKSCGESQGSRSRKGETERHWHSTLTRGERYPETRTADPRVANMVRAAPSRRGATAIR